MRIVSVLALAVGLAAAPATAQPESGIPAGFAAATAAFTNRDGVPVGQATLIETEHGLLIRVMVDKLSAGWHGFHIHAVGACGDPADGFKAAHGHVNPDGRSHGLLTPQGPEAGDLPNLFASGGKAEAEFYNTRLSLTGLGGLPALLDDDGAALVIHAQADDHLTQPIGGAGDRVACAVIEAPR